MGNERLFRRHTFWIAVVVGMAAVVIGTPFYEKKLPLETGSFVTLLQAGLLTKTMTFLLPLLAVFPAGGTFLNEYQSGFLRFHITRISKERYIKDQVTLTAMGGVAVVLAMGAFLFLTYFLGVYPLEKVGEVPKEEIQETVELLFRMALGAGILSNLSGICGAAFLNYYMGYGLPFISYYMLVILKERYLPDLYVLYPPEWLKAEQVWGENTWGLWAVLFLMLAATAMLYGILLHFRLKEVG